MEAKYMCIYLHIFTDLHAIYIAVNFQQGFYSYKKVSGVLFEKKIKKGKADKT